VAATAAPGRGAHDLPGGWPAIAAATAHEAQARLPFFIAHGGQAQHAGSVARAHLVALAGWPDALRLDDAAVTLTLPAPERTAFFEQANRALHAAGLITGWRNETYPVLALDDGPALDDDTAQALDDSPAQPQPPPPLASIERAAARFWGTLTFGAHCNGWVAGADGRPAALWIARRSFTKPTDPGQLDNLIGGGVPLGQSPAETVVREGWEEAGLTPAQMAGLQPGRRFGVLRDVPEGLQRELISVFDLALPPGLVPHNQDGEVHSLALLPVAEALAHAAAGDMTVDAALVTLDFALRHRLLAAGLHAALQARAAALWRGPARLEP